MDRETRKGSQQTEEKVHISCKVSLRSMRELDDLSPKENPEVVMFDLLKPEDSTWVKEILQEVVSEDPERRLCALYRFNRVFLGAVAKEVHGLAKSVECSTYFMQRGLLQEVKEGLREAVSTGEWYIVPKNSTWMLRKASFSTECIYTHWFFQGLHLT
jgi:hypothetical protein